MTQFFCQQGQTGFPFIDAIMTRFFCQQGQTSFPFIDAIMTRFFCQQGQTGFPFIDAIITKYFCQQGETGFLSWPSFSVNRVRLASCHDQVFLSTGWDWLPVHRCHHDPIFVLLSAGSDRLPVYWCHHDPVAARGLDSPPGSSCCCLLSDTRWPLDFLGGGTEGRYMKQLSASCI